MKFTFAPQTRPLPGYTLLRGIHRGGFGEVYQGVSDGGKSVALKLLHDNHQIELRGVRQCLNLKHRNLVNLFDVVQDADGDYWVVMEYVNGVTLDDVLATFPKGLPLGEVRDWMAGIAAGVDFLHSRGIIHRDLKPSNLYQEDGQVKVGDVGLSKLSEADRKDTHTQSIGTVYYMAPEIAHGHYGTSVDVYSAGVILCEMLTGRLPFTGESAAEVMMKHLTAVPDVSQVPTPLRKVVLKSLAKDPRERYGSVGELLAAFEKAADLPQTTATEPAAGR